jgi:hypothetical protein
MKTAPTRKKETRNLLQIPRPNRGAGDGIRTRDLLFTKQLKKSEIPQLNQESRSNFSTAFLSLANDVLI